MIDFALLQQRMKERLEEDRTIKIVEVVGSSLEAAAAQAAALLNLPVRRLEYEVAEKGSSGFMGVGNKNWKIRAYERLVAKPESAEAAEEAIVEELGLAVDTAPKIVDADGTVFIRLKPAGVFLKVTAPTGSGSRATEVQAHTALSARSLKNIDTAMVTRTVKAAAGEYVLVGSFEHNAVNDVSVAVGITAGDMEARITMMAPGLGGCDISEEGLADILRGNQVVYGIKEDVLRDIIDRPMYKESILVAEGTPPEDGRDAYIQYDFETDPSQMRMRESSDGRVDFKEMNTIQNVVEGQPLARKIPAENGKSGSTVTGKMLPAKNGKDILLPLGNNVRAGDDGVTILAELNGQVVFSAGKINVEPVYVVSGNVNVTTGNIIFLGTVIINGNVEDGLTVKAEGNIEVKGTVEKAELDAEGDIIVHQGIQGKNGGIVRSGKNVFARFIENCSIESGDSVIVSDGIVNSNVDAFKRIICNGKRAHIVGGRLRATEEINAKSIGSPEGGTETICEVGFDPKSKEQLELLAANRTAATEELAQLQLNLQTLINIKKQRKSLPEDKESQLNDLMERRKELTEALKRDKEEWDRIQEFLNSLKAVGRVSASQKLYPGTRIIIRELEEQVRDECKAVTFVVQDGLLRATHYEEPKIKAPGVPDGNSAH